VVNDLFDVLLNSVCQALIDLNQSVIQTHKPTWTDC
jgi:hypothetical protein